MRRVVLYIAMSLDGYIADGQGGVDWIQGEDKGVEPEDTFTPFFRRVDTVVMGRRTYDQIVTELSPDRWPYEGATTYVLTHSPGTHEGNVRFVGGEVCRLVETLKHETGKDIWICGGAAVAGRLIGADMVDVYHLAIVPVILGEGIRLFAASSPKMALRLVETKKYNGIMEMVYERSRGEAFAIRRMQAGDLDRVMQIWLSANLQAHDFIPESYWRGQFDNVSRMIPEADVYVCGLGPEVVGFIGLAGTYIAGLFVAPEFQGRGVGKRLLDYARGLRPELSLNVYQQNRRAVRFYQREGFVVEREGADEETKKSDYLMVCPKL